MLVPSLTQWFSGQYLGAPNALLSEGIQFCVACLPWKCSDLQLEASRVWGRRLFLLSFSTCVKLKGLVGLKRQSKCTPCCLPIRLGHIPGRGESCLLLLVCHLLLCFSLDRSKDPWKWPFSSETGVLLTSYWAKAWENPLSLPQSKSQCPFFVQLPRLTDSAPPVSCLQEYQILWSLWGWGTKKNAVLLRYMLSISLYNLGTV